MTESHLIGPRITAAGPLTNPLVDRLQAIITSAAPEIREFVIDASGLTAIDPVAAARLWLFCDRGVATGRREIRIAGLPRAVARRLKRHPLRAFLANDESLFDDPFGSPAPSNR